MGSFSEEESFFTPRKLAIGLGGVALVGLLILAAPTAYENYRNSPLSGRVTTEQIVEELERDPRLRGMMTAFRTHYPAEFQAFLQRIATAKNERGETAASREAFEFMNNFMRSKLQFIASAPSQDLKQLAAGIADLYEGLRRHDPNYCARFFMVGPAPDDRLPENVQPLMLQLNVLQFRAARHGEDRKGVTRGALNGADQLAFAVQAQAIDRQAAELIGTPQLASAAPARQCDAGVTMFRAIANLPTDQSANVLAAVLTAAAAAR